MPVRAPTKRLVLIAQAVDVTPEELEEAPGGRTPPGASGR